MAPLRLRVPDAQAEVAAITARDALGARQQAHRDYGLSSRVVCDGVDTNVMIVDMPLRDATSFSTSSSSSSAAGLVGSAAIKVHTGRAGANGMADSERQCMATLRDANMCVPPLAMMTGLHGHASQVYIYPNAGRNLTEVSKDLAPELAAGGQRAQAGFEFIVGVGYMAATGLCEMHSKGLAHHDVKRDNIFISDRGVARIGDLGLTSWFHSDELPGTDPVHPAVVLQTRLTWDTRRRVKDDAAMMARYNDGRGDVLALGVALWEMATNGVLPAALAFSERYTVMEPLFPLFLGSSPAYVQQAVHEAFIDRWCTFVASGALPAMLERTVPHAGLRKLLTAVICAPDDIPSAADLLDHPSFNGHHERIAKFLEVEGPLWQKDCNAALVVGHRALQAEGSVACSMAAAVANLAPANSISCSSSSSSGTLGSERIGKSSASLGSTPAVLSSPVANEAAAGSKGGGQTVLPTHRNQGSRSSPAGSLGRGSSATATLRRTLTAPAAALASSVLAPVAASPDTSSTGTNGQAVLPALLPAHHSQHHAKSISHTSRSSPSSPGCSSFSSMRSAATAPAAMRTSLVLVGAAASPDMTTSSSDTGGRGDNLAAGGSGAAGAGDNTADAAVDDAGSAAADQSADGAAPKPPLVEMPATTEGSSSVDGALAGDQATQTQSADAGSAAAGCTTANHSSSNSLSSGAGEQGTAGATRYVPGSLALVSANLMPSHQLDIDDDGNDSRSWGSTAAAAAATAVCVLVPAACGASPAATLLAAAMVVLA